MEMVFFVLNENMFESVDNVVVDERVDNVEYLLVEENKRRSGGMENERELLGIRVRMMLEERKELVE